MHVKMDRLRRYRPAVWPSCSGIWIVGMLIWCTMVFLFFSLLTFPFGYAWHWCSIGTNGGEHEEMITPGRYQPLYRHGLFRLVFLFLHSVLMGAREHG